MVLKFSHAFPDDYLCSMRCANIGRLHDRWSMEAELKTFSVGCNILCESLHDDGKAGVRICFDMAEAGNTSGLIIIPESYSPYKGLYGGMDAHTISHQ
jgi:hypothetical protein